MLEQVQGLEQVYALREGEHFGCFKIEWRQPEIKVPEVTGLYIPVYCLATRVDTIRQ